MLNRIVVLLAVTLVSVSLYLAPSHQTQAADLKVCGSPDVQFLGFSDALNKQMVGGFPLTELSGIAYDPQRGVYYVVADRLGTTPAHVFTLTLPLTGDSMGVPYVSSVVRLADGNGEWFTGINLDGEGIALVNDNEMFVSSEGGTVSNAQPAVHRFTLSGGHMGSLTVPPAFLIGVNNASFEGLSMSPSKRSLFVAMEGQLPHDIQLREVRSRLRIIRYEQRGETYVPAEQYFYLTEPGRNASDLGVSEVLALSDTELLVMERGFVPGEGNTVRVFKTSLAGARDVSSVTALAPSATPLTKTLLFDLATCPDSSATVAPGATQPNKLLDNFEAMTLGPELPGGRRGFVMVSDENSGTNQTARVIALAIDNKLLR